MSRNVNQTMDKIFNRLIEAIDDEDRIRISITTRRHIKAAGDEKKVIDLVKKATILSEDINIPICGVMVQEKKYIVVKSICAEIFENIELGFIARDENEELFQGLGMLAIAYNFLSLKTGLHSTEILDKCLAFDDEDLVFSFWDIADFFEEYSVFEVVKDIFELEYSEDFNRLQALSLSETSQFFNSIAKNKLKDFLLLNSSRSVAATVLNSLDSTQWEYAYLQMYQCLEYLFAVQNAIILKNKYKTDLYIAIDIASDNILRKNEIDSLISVLINADKMQKQQFAMSVFKEEIEYDKITEKIAKSIYNTRCSVAHLRFNQVQDEFPTDKNVFMQEFISLILNIFQNLDAVVTDICINKSTWRSFANDKH